MHTLSLSPAPAAIADNGSQLLTRLLGNGPELVLINQHHAGRRLAEQYIADKFRQDHHASIDQFMPQLLTLNCLGLFSAAVGLKPAAGEALFVEHYLDLPAEQALGRLIGHRVERSRMTELGNLVSTRRGSSQLLFVVLTAMLHRAGINWVIFTASSQVQHLLQRLNLATLCLCPADKRRLPDGGSRWGSYYRNQPQVAAIAIADAWQTLAGNRFACAIINTFEPAIDRLAMQFAGCAA